PAPDVAGAHHGPHVLAVGRGRGRGGVSFIAAYGAVVVGQDVLPQRLAIGAHGQEHQAVPVGGGQENLVVPNNRGRAGRARQGQAPGDVVSLAPGERQIRFVADAVLSGAAPLWPVFGACALGDERGGQGKHNRGSVTACRHRWIVSV